MREVKMTKIMDRHYLFGGSWRLLGSDLEYRICENKTGRHKGYFAGS